MDNKLIRKNFWFICKLGKMLVKHIETAVKFSKKKQPKNPARLSIKVICIARENNLSNVFRFLYAQCPPAPTASLALTLN